MRLILRATTILSLLLAQVPAASAELGPSLLNRLGDSGSLDVLILLESAPQGPQLARQIGHPTAYQAVRHDLEARNHRSVDDFLTRTRVADIPLNHVETFWLAPFVSAQVEAHDLERLAALPGVAAVVENAPIELIAPVATGGATAAADATAAGQEAIGARTAWHNGLTGKGVLVASIDTGVDGTHPALKDRYRGINHSAAESWRDPFGGTTPDDPVGHGTHTMGTVLGRDGADTIGIAPDAEWIAAGVVDRGLPFAETITGLVEAFQWLADPDGNPNTHSDLPDVVLNSWGIPQGVMPSCDNTFWYVVDNLEALGTVVVFAAGNEGPGAATLRLPADRGDLPLHCFSVGAVDATDPSYAPALFSSRGPVSCNSALIKPELVAPGVGIRSAKPGGGYQILSGTSMAAPHVVGAIALMRQYNPDATPEQIKQALVESAHDVGTLGPDFATGYGLLDIPGAIAKLPAPKPVTWKWNVPVIADPGDDAAELTLAPARIVMQNLGRSLEGVRVEVSALSPLDRLDGQNVFPFDYLKPDFDMADLPISISTTAEREPGERVWLQLHITATTPVLDTTLRMGIQVGSLPQTAALAQQAGKLTVAATNYGRFDASEAITLSVTAPEFVLAGQSIPFAAGLRILESGIDHSGYAGEKPFEPTPDGLLKTGESGVLSRTAFADTRSINPSAVRFDQTAYAGDAGAGDYILFAYHWARMQAEFGSGSLRLGGWFDWDLPGAETAVNSSVPGAVVVQNGESYVGAVWLGQGSVRGVYDAALMSSRLPTPGAGDALTVSAAESFLLTLTGYASAVADGQFGVALVAADNLADWEAAAERAREQYARLSGYVEPALPSAFTIHPNYPNPFNPSTTIHYVLGADAVVEIAVYNVLGQKVSTFPAEFQTAGEHRVVWDASDDHGRPLPSGVYLVRVAAGDQAVTRKMTLLR